MVMRRQRDFMMIDDRMMVFSLSFHPFVPQTGDGFARNESPRVTHSLVALSDKKVCRIKRAFQAKPSHYQTQSVIHPSVIPLYVLVSAFSDRRRKKLGERMKLLFGKNEKVWQIFLHSLRILKEFNPSKCNIKATRE